MMMMMVMMMMMIHVAAQIRRRTRTHTLCEPAKSKCMIACHKRHQKSHLVQKFTGKMPRPRLGPEHRHTLCASLGNRNASQDFTRATFHGNLLVKWRRPNWAQDGDERFVRACAVETHVKISQKPLYTEIDRLQATPNVSAAPTGEQDGWNNLGLAGTTVFENRLLHEFVSSGDLCCWDLWVLACGIIVWPHILCNWEWSNWWSSRRSTKLLCWNSMVHRSSLGPMSHGASKSPLDAWKLGRFFKEVKANLSALANFIQITPLAHWVFPCQGQNLVNPPAGPCRSCCEWTTHQRVWHPCFSKPNLGKLEWKSSKYNFCGANVARIFFVRGVELCSSLKQFCEVTGIRIWASLVEVLDFCWAKKQQD